VKAPNHGDNVCSKKIWFSFIRQTLKRTEQNEMKNNRRAHVRKKRTYKSNNIIQ
jgi:hypothetical protein